MKHYLVCGGAGFIGINLCHKLLELGHRVTVIDNLYCGNESNLPKEVRFIKLDIIDIPNPIYENYDGIFNLACPASPKNYQKNPFYTIKTCVQGILHLLNIAKNCNIPILQSSTSEIYGDATETPQAEEYKGNVNCTGSRACYDEGKRLAETMCFDHNRIYGTKIRVVRIFNTYGPYMDEHDGRVISNFITQSLRNKKLTVYGHGKQTRSFCYVDDMVDGLIKAIESEHNGPINLGNPDERTIIYIANLVNSMTGNTETIKKCILPQDDPIRRCPDITKAKSLLGWTPSVSLDVGLRKTINYFRNV